MNDFCFRLRCCFSPWHLSFFALFLLLLLYCVRQRFLLKSAVDSDDKISNQSDHWHSPAGDNDDALLKRFRRRLAPFKLELFGNILSRRDFISGEQMSKFERIFDQYNQSRKSANRTIGMRYVDTFVPGEVNLTKMDKDTIKRLQTIEIVDAMANSGGQLVEKQIEQVMRRHAQLNEVIGAWER